MTEDINMACNTKTVAVTVENFTFYSKSGYFYFTVKNCQPVFENNQIILATQEIFQFKINFPIETFVPEKIFTTSNLIIDIDTSYDDCYIKGVKSKRFSAKNICGYENDIRKINQ